MMTTCSGSSPSFLGRNVALCTCAMLALPIGSSSKCTNSSSIDLPVDRCMMSDTSA